MTIDEFSESLLEHYLGLIQEGKSCGSMDDDDDDDEGESKGKKKMNEASKAKKSKKEEDDDDDDEEDMDEEFNVEEDVNALLAGEELSEEFQEKARTIFEAALRSKVSEI